MISRPLTKCLISASVVLVMASSVAFAQDKREQIAGWAYVSRTDKLDGTQSFTATSKGEDGSLSVKCDEPGSVIYLMITTNKFLGDGSYPKRSVKYRVDNREAMESSWLYEKNRAFTLDDAVARAAISNVMHGDKFVARLTTYEFLPVTVEIKITGIDAVLARMHQDCKS